MSNDTNPCKACDGEGAIHTGIDEAPMVDCRKCGGLGYFEDLFPVAASPVAPIDGYQHDSYSAEHVEKVLGLSPVAPESQTIDIAEMVNRFLGWRIPQTFAPDCGISFDGRKDDEWNKNKSWPVGTNLFNADEAKAMFIHCLATKAMDEQSVIRIANDVVPEVGKNVSGNGVLAFASALLAAQVARPLPKPVHRVGAADGFGPTKDGCCGVTVTERCEGCPYGAAAVGALPVPVAPIHQVHDTTHDMWVDVAKEQYDRCNPKYRRVVSVVAGAALPAPVVATPEQAHVMPPVAAPVSQHGDSSAVLLAAKDALTLLSRNQIGTRWMRSDAAIASAALGVIADYYAATADQSSTAGSAKGGMQGQDAPAAVEVARQPDEPSGNLIALTADHVKVAQLAVERRIEDIWQDANDDWGNATGGPDPHEIFAQRIIAAMLEELRAVTFAAPSSQAAPTAARCDCLAQCPECRKDGVEGSQAAPDAKAEQDDAKEGVELLAQLIDSIEKHGNYSNEATLTFLRQISQCFAAPSQAAPAATAELTDEQIKEKWHRCCRPEFESDYLEFARAILAAQAAQKGA